MMIKLMILKIVPRISPFPIGSRPARMKIRPAKMANEIALEQYFFWVSLIVSMIGMAIFFFFFFLFRNFKDLSINDDPATDNA